MTKQTLALSLTLAAALSSLTACDLFANPESPYCEETVTVLDSLDAETPSGIKPIDILHTIEGERVLELEYVESGPNTSAEVTLAKGGSGTTGLTLELQHAAGEVRWVESTEVYPSSGGPDLAIGINCDDRIEFDAELTFISEDGVFDEILDVVVKAAVSEWDGGQMLRAEISRAFEPDELDGEFEVTSVMPAEYDDIDYNLDIYYPLIEGEDQQVGQPRGLIGGGVGLEDGDTAAWFRFDIASFGGWEF